MEAVTLTAELKDEASAPLGTLANKVEGASKSVRKSAKSQGDAVAAAAKQIEGSTKAVGDDLDGMSDAAKKSGGKFSKALGGLSSAVKDAGAAAGKQAQKVGASTGDFIKNGIMGGMVGVGAALTAGLVGAISDAGANSVLAAQLGLSPEEAAKAGRIAGNLYKAGLGESMESVNGAISAVASGLADINDTESIERLSKKAINMESAFGVGVEEVVNTSGIMMQQGLAKNADEAMDLLVGSMQKVPAAMRGELLPIMDEYSGHFNALGISGADAMGIVTNASKTGAISMDKVGDALKELTIRATDGSKASGDALASIGLQGDAIGSAIAGGGKGAKDAFNDIVQGLYTIKDPAEQAQAAIALFGAPLEDLGTNGINDFLNQIDPMGDSFDNMAGKADELGKNLNEGAGSSIEKFKRVAMSSFTEMAAGVIPIIEPIFTFLEKYAPLLAPIALGLGVIAGVIWIMTTAQAAYNAVAAMNPTALLVIAIVAAIALLVAGIMWAYNNIGWFKDAVDAVFNFIRDTITNLVSFWNTDFFPALQLIGQWFSDVWGGIMEFLAPVFAGIGLYFTTLIGIWQDVLIPIISKVVEWFGDKLGGAISGIGGFIDGAIKAFQSFVDFYNTKIKPVFDAIGEVNGKIGNFLGGVGKALGFSGGGVVEASGGAVLGGYAPGRDTIAARLSPGESVLVPELTRAIGPRNIMALNKQYSHGRPAGSGPSPAFSGGGVAGGGKSVVYDVKIYVDGGGGAPGNIYNEVKQAIREIADEENRRGY